jgi:hypothetical protein
MKRGSGSGSAFLIGKLSKESLHTMKLKDQASYEQQVRELLKQGRRDFLQGVGGAAAATLFAGAASVTVRAQDDQLNRTAAPDDFGGTFGAARVEKVYNARVQAATFQKIQPLPDHPGNGDEERYPNRIGSYSKGLPHNNLGEVDQQSYNTLMNALKTANPDDYERITMGGAVKLTNPQGGLGIDMEGPDPMHLYQPPLPVPKSLLKWPKITGWR